MVITFRVPTYTSNTNKLCSYIYIFRVNNDNTQRGYKWVTLDT